MRKHVAIHVDVRCDLDQLPSFRRQAKHRALRHEQNFLLAQRRIVAVEGHLLHLVHEFPGAAFLEDAHLAIPDGQLQATSGETAAEHQLARSARDIDEAAAAHRPAVEFADIDIAGRIDLRQPENDAPTREEERATIYVEDALEAAIEQRDLGVLVVVLASEAGREWRYYSDDTERFLDAMNEGLQAHAEYPLDIALYDDPAWGGLSEFVAAEEH